jgi:hypothetical protein
MLDDRGRAAAPLGGSEGQGGIEGRPHDSDGEGPDERKGRTECGVENADAVAG